MPTPAQIALIVAVVIALLIGWLWYERPVKGQPIPAPRDPAADEVKAAAKANSRALWWEAAEDGQQESQVKCSTRFSAEECGSRESQTREASNNWDY